MTKIKNDLFLRACRKEKTERTPIWVMRQAGRYLPEYRKVREKADFLTMCKTPELAAEVTVQPVDLIGVDAAILFSDILVIPEAMGMNLEMHEGIGPVFPSPIRSENDAMKLKIINPNVELDYVMKAIELTKKELDGRVPLIGFSGAPWTLLTYMVEGKGSKNFTNVKKMIYNNPELAHKILRKLSVVVADYLSAKIDAGVDAVQIFDTWGGILSKDDYEEFSLKYIQMIVEQINSKNKPIIYFPKGVHNNYKKIVASGIDVLGIDWSIDIGEVRKMTDDKIALQGNLDPTVLYADENVIKKRALKIMESFGKGHGHIFNLGHGILPDVPPENLKSLVQFVKNNSSIFHT